MSEAIDILRIGRLAARSIGHPGTGFVVGVYERTVYIELSGGDFLCIGGPEVGNGPIMAIAATVPADDWRDAGIVVGQNITIDESGLTVGDAFKFFLGRHAIWQPAPWPAVGMNLAPTLVLLQDLMRERAPTDGLARVVIGNAAAAGSAPARAIERRATLNIATLSDWLEAQLSGDAAELASAGQAAVDGLIGLGPGLTPSGDDLISGLLIALHATDHAAAAAALASFVRKTPADATSKLSRAFIEAAIAGEPNEAMQPMLSCLLKGEPCALAPAFEGLDRIGHSSGWDMLAGIVIGLRGVAGAGDRQCGA